MARRQLLAAGLSPGVARREVVARRWRVLHPGVYATFSGTVPDRAQVWAALLRAGSGAVAAHRTALWLAGVIDERPDVIEVAIPHERRSAPIAGVRLHRARNLLERTHPAAQPPRLRLEPAVLATTEAATNAELVTDLVLRATQRRLTTAGRLRRELKAWPRHRWRSLLMELLQEVEDGVASALELRYARAVERAHGLPRGLRNQAEREAGSAGIGMSATQHSARWLNSTGARPTPPIKRSVTCAGTTRPPKPETGCCATAGATSPDDPA